MRIMLKISGEALGGGADSADERYDRETILYLVDQIQSLVSNGHEIALTLGGGNLFRGTTFVKELGIKRTTADYVGILGTMQNSLVIRDFLELSGLKTIMIRTCFLCLGKTSVHSIPGLSPCFRSVYIQSASISKALCIC